jgi:hypothetical protein
MQRMKGWRIPRWRQLREAWKRNAFSIVLFLVVAVAQYSCVSFQVTRTLDKDLAASASEVARLAYDGQRWTTEAFSSGSADVPNWFVVRADGAILDIESSLPSVFGTVAPPPAAAFVGPTTVVSEFGETWRLFAKQLDDGFLALGVRDPKDPPAVDSILLHDADLFGSNKARALMIPQTRTSRDVDVAIVGGDGRMLRAWGGVPLKMVDVQERLPEGVRDVRSGNRTYRLISILIRSTAGSVVGRVAVHREITTMQAALRQLLLFDAALLGLSILCLLGWTASHIRRSIDIEEAQERGEGPEIEFKSSFQWDIQKQIQNKELQREVVKAVAAFLNTDGGYLFIGVTEVTGHAVVCGLEPDINLMEGNVDKLLRAIVQRLLNDIGHGFSALWQARIERIGGRAICAIIVDPATHGVWLGEELFHRSGSSSRPLTGREAAQYLETRRPSRGGLLG